MTKKKFTDRDYSGWIMLAIVLTVAASWFICGRYSTSFRTDIEKHLCKMGEIPHDWSDLELVGNRDGVTRKCLRCFKTEDYIFIGIYNSLKLDYREKIVSLARSRARIKVLEQALSVKSEAPYFVPPEDVPEEPLAPPYFFGETNGWIILTNNYSLEINGSYSFTNVTTTGDIINGDIISDSGVITIDADIEAKKITYDKLIRRGKQWWEFWK